MVFCFFFLLVGVFVFFFYNVFYVILLLSLELILLSVFCFFLMEFTGLVGISSVFGFFLVMICVGVFGISLLISVFRSFGSDRGMSFFVF